MSFVTFFLLLVPCAERSWNFLFFSFSSFLFFSLLLCNTPKASSITLYWLRSTLYCSSSHSIYRLLHEYWLKQSLTGILSYYSRYSAVLHRVEYSIVLSPDQKAARLRKRPLHRISSHLISSDCIASVTVLTDFILFCPTLLVYPTSCSFAFFSLRRRRPILVHLEYKSLD